MYASIRRYRTAPGNVEKLRRLLEEELVPALTEVRGFVAYYLVDTGEGHVASVSIFVDRSGADESNVLAAYERELIPGLLPEPPEVTAGQIILERTRPAHGSPAQPSARRSKP